MEVKQKITEIKKHYENWQVVSVIDPKIHDGNAIISLCCNCEGTLFLTTSKNNVIYLFDQLGNVIDEVEGVSGNTFVDPRFLSCAKDYFVVADVEKGCLFKIESQSHICRAVVNVYPSLKNTKGFSAVTIDHEDNVYAVEKKGTQSVIYMFDDMLKQKTVFEYNCSLDSWVSGIFTTQAQSFPIILVHEAAKLAKLTKGESEILCDFQPFYPHLGVLHNGFFFITVAGEPNVTFLKISLNGDLVYSYENPLISSPAAICCYDNKLFIVSRNQSKIFVLSQKV